MEFEYKIYEISISAIDGYYYRFNLYKLINKKYKILRLAEKGGFKKTIKFFLGKINECDETIGKLDDICFMELTDRYRIETAKRSAFYQIVRVLQERTELVDSFKWYKKYNK